jgi:hypothetical protein
VLLVDRIISSAWRLRRVLRAEADLMASEPNTAADFRSNTGKYLERVSRYETTLERGLYRRFRSFVSCKLSARAVEGNPGFSDGTGVILEWL